MTEKDRMLIANTERETLDIGTAHGDILLGWLAKCYYLNWC